jgi:hypothetical protein
VATAPIAQVVDKVSAPPPAAPALARAALGEVDLEGAYWNTNPGGPWELAAVDAAVHGAPLGPLLVDVDLRAEHWLKRTNPVFRPEDTNQFYLWQAQAGWYPADRRITLDAGRIIPWSVPLATVMDGAMVGWRGDGYELRGFGGLVPEPDTIAPTTTRATGGAAWVIEDRPSHDLVLRQEGRLAWSRSPELGDRVELAATGSAYVGKKLDLSLALQIGVGGTEHAPAYVDGARIELDYRPIARLALSGGFDYVGLTVPQPLVSAFYAGHSRHSDLSAFYDFGPFRLGAIGGTALDVTSALSRSWIGGEVQAPRFFTPRVSASLGYQEEFGWLSGRSAFLQVVARPADPLRLIARITWSRDDSLGVDQDELGGALSLVADLTERIALRLSALYRAVVDTQAFGSSPTGLNANATLRALF